MEYQKNIFLFFLVLFSALISAQELPPIEKYLPETYGGGTQNWSVSQSDNKYIYVGNNNGLLEFNGSSWTLYPTPNETVMRSVNVINDRIYTGFYMNFGYWKKNNFGGLEYTSLSDAIKERLIEDEQFWNIVNQENWVLFQSLNRIYLYNSDNEEISIIESEVGILNLFNVNGVIYYQDTTQGIFKIEKGKPKLITDFSISGNDKVVNISDTPDGILMLTSTNGFYKYSYGSISKWNIPAYEVLKNSKVYSGTRLKDKSFVLGTISKGIIYLSSTGEVIHQINQTKGLSNNTVLSLFEDSDENIWLGLDNGINCVNIKSPIRRFNDDKGEIGTVYTSVVFEDFLYLGTNQGLFYKKLGADEQFKFVEGTNGQVWCLFVYDNALFCGHDSGTYLINNNTSTLISSMAGAWNFKTISGHQDWLLQGMYNGLSLLEKKNNSWSFKHKIKGFDYSARFVEIHDKEVWINHEYKGLFRVKMDEQFSKILNINKDTLIERGKNSNVIKYKGDILYAHEQGVFTFDKHIKTFEKENIVSQISGSENDNTGKLIKDNAQGLWSFSQDNIGYISQSQFSDDLRITEIPIPRSLRKEMYGFENITHINNDKYLLGTTNGYMILDLSKINFKEHRILLDKVSVKYKGEEFSDVSLLEQQPVFKSNLNTISFAYAIPEYDKYLISKFQYKLDGFYEDWNNWTTNSSVIFENLPFGSYTFMVRAKTGNELTVNVAEYKFIIDRPWYFSTSAIVIYSLLLIIMLLLMHRAYKHYYTKQKQKLVEENKKQLELKELESEGEIMKLNNEKLIQDIESKNRELASSTMSIIKKNEILNTIKKELQKSETGNGGLKNVERIIDRNLNNKDDWKHFEEAFNNVDKDFLKKLKAKHKDLTPHDLRFCTYLRLNLSSKEIAPLLNISVRSVEIKRYRLRKKLHLQHEESLVNYILEI
ncbi:helix-turn-helix and ligand-binding sensor domain-containing protein [Aquimarina algiphila]|uniref:helix-turn-helix and ligand-binding sensor domain-containing protein n=1 Tax=Aquimarina algiphila TaxID=2047982 RepID=UPI001FCC4683|nr:triple tyrosine motif-containing protein [Aquimarina algiphila]